MCAQEMGGHSPDGGPPAEHYSQNEGTLREVAIEYLMIIAAHGARNFIKSIIG